MSSKSYEIAVRTPTGVLLAASPARFAWELTDLATADGHFLRGTFHVSLRALDDPTERKMLEQVFLTDRDALTLPAATAHFFPPIQSAAQRAAKQKPAEQWLADSGRDALRDLLKQAAVDVAFACGLEVLAPIRLELDSPTLTQRQMQAMQQTLANEQAAGRVEHFQKAVELLRQFESQRGGVAPTAVTKAIESLNPADRGAMLKTLLLAGSGKSTSTALWAVAGTSLIHIDLAGSAPPRAIELPTTLGPLRSVQSTLIDETPHWLIGARDGVFACRASDVSAVTAYRDGGVESPQGFSRAIVRPGQLIACHSDAGLITWTLGQPDRPATALRPAELGGSPRNLLAFDSVTLLFSVAGQLCTLTGGEIVRPLGPDGASNVVAIVPDDHRLLIAYEDGTLRALERATQSLITLEHRGQRITHAAGLPWLGGQRLLVTGDDGAIDCVGVDDDLFTQYASPHRGVRRVIASASHVAALSGDRTRVILWNIWDGKVPVREISLARVTTHRVADLVLA